MSPDSKLPGSQDEKGNVVSHKPVIWVREKCTQLSKETGMFIRMHSKY